MVNINLSEFRSDAVFNLAGNHAASTCLFHTPSALLIFHVFLFTVAFLCNSTFADLFKKLYKEKTTKIVQVDRRRKYRYLCSNSDLLQTIFISYLIAFQLFLLHSVVTSFEWHI